MNRLAVAGFGVLFVSVVSISGCSTSTSADASSPAASVASVTPSSASPTPSPTEVAEDVRVMATFIVLSDSPNDGAEVRVTDGSGNLLGFDTLHSCPACEASFYVKESSDGFYQVSVGALSPLSYAQSDVVNGVLEVSGQIS